MMDVMQIPWVVRWLFVWGAMIGCAACCYSARTLRPGLPRLLATLPALIVMHCLPLLWDFMHEPLAATSTTFLCTRLTAGKVFAFILGRGALTLPLTFVQFTAVLLAPFMPAELAASKVNSSSTTAAAAAAQGATLTTNTPASAAAASGDACPSPAAVILNPFMLKDLNLPPFPSSFWQRVSPMQRFSIDSSRGSSSSRSSSSGHPSPAPSLVDSSSPLDSPRIAAVHNLQQQQEQQQQEQQQQDSGVSATAESCSGDTDSSNLTAGAAAPTAAAADPKGTSQPTPSRFAPKQHTTSLNSKTHHTRTHSTNSSCHSSSVLSVANLLLNAAVTLAFLVYSCHSIAAVTRVSAQLGGLWVMWRAMEGVMGAASRPARAWLGVGLAPHFKNPFASTSLTDFWARRWNITQGLVLRFYVYEPIVQGRLVAPQAAPAAHTTARADCSIDQQQQQLKPPSGRGSTLKHRRPHSKAPHSAAAAAALGGVAPSGSTPTTALLTPPAKAPPPPPAAAGTVAGLLAGPSAAAAAPRWRRELAAAATFLVSGLEHELFLWYLTRSWGTTWLAFFTLQGLLLALEGKVKRAGRALGLQLHPFVSHLAVLLVLGVAADALFWPPLLQPCIVEPVKAAVPLQLRSCPGWFELLRGPVGFLQQ